LIDTKNRFLGIPIIRAEAKGYRIDLMDFYRIMYQQIVIASVDKQTIKIANTSSTFKDDYLSG